MLVCDGWGTGPRRRASTRERVIFAHVSALVIIEGCSTGGGSDGPPVPVNYTLLGYVTMCGSI